MQIRSLNNINCDKNHRMNFGERLPIRDVIGPAIDFSVDVNAYDRVLEEMLGLGGTGLSLMTKAERKTIGQECSLALKKQFPAFETIAQNARNFFKDGLKVIEEREKWIERQVAIFKKLTSRRRITNDEIAVRPLLAKRRVAIRKTIEDRNELNVGAIKWQAVRK